MAVLVFAACVRGQIRETNPFPLTDTVAMGKGKQLYSFYCVFCHGMDGISGRGAQLASSYRKHGSSDREMYRTIADGVPGTEMSGHFLEEDEIWKILLFVRQLEQSVGKSGQGCGAGAGDADRGSALFRGKAGCHACHGKTSRLGPDLTGVGATRSREHLRESILNPDKEISRRFRTAMVKTRAGESVRGLLMNEDEYTVHVMDTSERIRSFRRVDLIEVSMLKESLMPSYTGKITVNEMNDLLAYLCTTPGGSK